MQNKTLIKQSFPVIGVELKTTTLDERHLTEIPRFWEMLIREGRIGQIPNKKCAGTVLGVCMDCEPDGGFSYVIGTEVENHMEIPDGMVAKTIPAARYAVFSARGPYLDRSRMLSGMPARSGCRPLNINMPDHPILKFMMNAHSIGRP